MRVEVAKTAGFCFGVDRAVSTVYKLLEEGKQAATLGPIIHNPQVTGDLAARGVVTVSRPQETPAGYTLVIRSHGVAQAVEEVKRRSRQYAKRQLTWFRRDPNIEWILLEKDQDFSSVIQDSTNYLREKGLP